MMEPEEMPENAAKNGPDSGSIAEERTPGAEARIDSDDFVPGMNPRPTLKTDSLSAEDGLDAQSVSEMRAEAHWETSEPALNSDGGFETGIAEPEILDSGAVAVELPPPAPHRTPNLADALIFILFLVMGFLVTLCLVGIAMHFHLFGLKDVAGLQTDTITQLATQFLVYLVALAGAIPFFSMAWGRNFFRGIHWNGGTAFRLRGRLVVTAFAGNLLAVVGNFLLPFPQHAPIDKMFQNQTQAWFMFGFGVTVAPFFEEMIFRGFLLPAVATTWDWCRERMTHVAPLALDEAGNPIWSRAAMIFASLTVSLPFAMMHAGQVGRAWGPLLVLYCVSLLLCTVRLVTRSLAASTVVHATYNFALFAVMFMETGGFRHLDKL